jgi:hypothetical protein
VEFIAVSIEKRPENQGDQHLDGTPSIVSNFFKMTREAVNPDH